MTLLEIAEHFAEALHDQADERQQRSFDANHASEIPEAKREQWAMSFATSYQVLRGIALAMDETTTALRTRSTQEGDKG